MIKEYRKLILLLLAGILCVCGGCGKQGKEKEAQPVQLGQESEKAGRGNSDGNGEESLLNPEGMTLESRVRPPKGYERDAVSEDSLCGFLRGYALKEDQSPVYLYNGKPKKNQKAHQAVFDLPMEAEDLQQCADSVMRVYTEYFWETGKQDKIGFHFANGFYAEYTKWREGYRIQVDGNDVRWIKSENYDDSYECLKDYLRMVFSYAGTLSMDGESEEIEIPEIACGDVFLKGASPGHVVMVVDVCENSQGKKAFLLAQGYMPAQEFHLLKNPAHEGIPWYYEEEVTYPFETPEYTFEEGSLRRLEYQ